MGYPLGAVEPRRRGPLTASTERIVIALVVAASLILGFAVASLSGIRPLGGIVLLIGGGWCAWRLWRTAGPARTVFIGVVYVAAFIVSHPLGDLIGTWPAVFAVALVAGVVAFGAGRPATA